MTKRAYEPPAITSEANVPPRSDVEQLDLAELVRLRVGGAPFVLAYLVMQPDGSARLATASNATEPQHIMRNALLELEMQADAMRRTGTLQ